MARDYTYNFCEPGYHDYERGNLYPGCGYRETCKVCGWERWSWEREAEEAQKLPESIINIKPTTHETP